MIILCSLLVPLHEHNNIMFAFAQIISFYMSSLTQTLGPQNTERSPYHQSSWGPRPHIPSDMGAWGPHITRNMGTGVPKLEGPHFTRTPARIGFSGGSNPL